MNRLYLTGFMGSGKTYVGKRLAALLGRPFVDLDELIESSAGQTIAEIFATHGEAHFRQLEADALRRTGHLPLYVMATGGGAPCFHGGMDWMNDHGLTVFLDVSPTLLTHRLEAERAHRPLLAEGNDLLAQIKHRLSARRPTYEKAHLHLRIDNNTRDVARLLADHLAQATGH